MNALTPEAVEAARESLGRRLFEKDREWNRTTNGATYLAEFDFPWNELTDKGREYWRMQADAALSVAAPFLMAQAKADGLREAADELESETEDMHGNTEWWRIIAPAWLRRRADALEGEQ
jgi:hypothetical protein